MRHTSLMICILCLCGCNSAEQIAANREARDAQISEAAKQRAEIIKAKASSEARLLCQHSLNKQPGTAAFENCFRDAYNAKIAAEREALMRRDEQRQAEAARIFSDFASRHGSVTCASSYGVTRCDY